MERLGFKPLTYFTTLDGHSFTLVLEQMLLNSMYLNAMNVLNDFCQQKKRQRGTFVITYLTSLRQTFTFLLSFESFSVIFHHFLSLAKRWHKRTNNYFFDAVKKIKKRMKRKSVEKKCVCVNVSVRVRKKCVFVYVSLLEQQSALFFFPCPRTH